jgi:hypothetical protein
VQQIVLVLQQHKADALLRDENVALLHQKGVSREFSARLRVKEECLDFGSGFNVPSPCRTDTKQATGSLSLDLKQRANASSHSPLHSRVQPFL